MKIVIVDDNLTMRKVLSSLFESQGHQVLAALEDGSGLLACVKNNAPDLVCLDYNLPGKNGLELLTELQGSSPEVDVVIITGSTDPDLDGKAANAGACGFLRKPFSQPQILDELKQIEQARRIAINADKPSAADLPAQNSSKKTVVIVDDSESMRMLLKGILRNMGWTVMKTVANGKEGVAAAKEYHPSVVCLDVDMPVMSGLEALPLIREASPLSKVVMVTGNTNKTFVEAAIAGGAKGYILKPVRPAHVEGFMKKLLA